MVVWQTTEHGNTTLKIKKNINTQKRYREGEDE